MPGTDENGKRLKGPLSVSHPELAAEWHPTKNGDLAPGDVTPGSGRKVWWRCRIDQSHEWDAFVYSRTHGNGCPYCAGQKVLISGSLASLFPELAAEWQSSKNGSITPDEVRPGSNMKVWWKCP